MIFITAITIYCLWVYVYTVCTFSRANLLQILISYHRLAQILYRLEFATFIEKLIADK